ncbi:Nuf2 family-domain-containing protein [Fomes fomentarius]|nr:Nuf2 family-domain-containing protein [Fomes fomentarius]
MGHLTAASQINKTRSRSASRVCAGCPTPVPLALKFWFPSMSPAEIVDAFSGWGYSISPEQVSRPTSDFVLGVYSACLEQVTGITMDSLQESVEQSLATTENPEIYSQALVHNLMLYHFQRFANAAKINDFSSKDLYFPDPDRTRSIFSAFINFIKFSEQSETFINRLRDQSTAVIKERQAVSEEIVELEHRMTEFKVKRAEDEPKCQTLREENAALLEQVISYKERQMGFLQDIENLKQEKAALVAEKEKVTTEMSVATENINRTRSRIVQSPERIKRNINTMGNTAAEDKRTVAANEAKTRDLQTKIAALLNIEKDVRSCVEQLQTIEKEVRALDAAQKELGDLRDTLDRKHGERAELVMRRERVHKQLSNAQEKLERAQRHVEDKRLASQQTIERLQREYEEMSVERRDNDRQVEELRAEADEIERKMADHMKTSQAELNELLTEYWKLRHETEVYMETLANKLGMQVRST